MTATKLLEADILDLVSKKDLVLLCGAGISINSPSNLPNAKNLTTQILESLLGKSFKVNHFDDLRPEVIFQRIIEYNEKKLLNKLTEILETRHFNENHLFCGYLLHNNTSIITTNFDTLIEKAAEYLKVNYNKSITEAQKKPALFKIHGCIENSHSLKLSINHVNQGLANWKKNYLKSLIKDKTLLVLGYSGLDQLDILPVLKNSKYKKIIWVNHVLDSKSNPKPNFWIKQLPRLYYKNVNTSNLIKVLLPKISSVNYRNSLLSKYQSSLVYLELLEHENQYAEILKYIRRCSIQNSIRIKVFKLISAGSTIKRDKNYRALRESITNEVFLKAKKCKNSLLTFMGDAANTPKRWNIIEKVYDNELSSGSTDYYLCESILGYIAWMAHQNKFSKGKKYLKQIKPIIEKQGYTLLEARFGIAQGLIVKREFECGKFSKREIRSLEQNIDKSMFLAGKEIFNDEYFYNKATMFKAFVLIFKNKTVEAKALLKKSIKYFRRFSINNHIDALDIYSSALLEEGNKELAIRYINNAIKLDKRSQRTYYLGSLLRKKALMLDKHNSNKIEQLLQESIGVFQSEFLFIEAERSRKLLNQ